MNYLRTMAWDRGANPENHRNPSTKKRLPKLHFIKLGPMVLGGTLGALEKNLCSPKFYEMKLGKPLFVYVFYGWPPLSQAMVLRQFIPGSFLIK